MIEPIVITREEKHEWIVTRSTKPDRRFAVSQTKKARDKSRNTNDDPFALPLIGPHGRIDILILRHTLAFRFAANELDSHILRIHTRQSTHRLRFEFRHIYCSGKLNIIIKRDVKFDYYDKMAAFISSIRNVSFRAPKLIALYERNIVAEFQLVYLFIFSPMTARDYRDIECITIDTQIVSNIAYFF